MVYSHLLTENNSDTEINEVDQKEYPSSLKNGQLVSHSSKWCLASMILTAVNICVLIALITLGVSFRQNHNYVPGPPPPWSPVRADIEIGTVNRMYRPQKIFQSETSDEVEKAWTSWEEEYDHLLVLSTDQTKDRLPITVDAFLDPGHSVYGLAVYHQMHCLNHIRKTFYGERFFPHQKQEKVQFHKNHCFDMLRQAILCHADIAIMHWWNDTYSVVDEKGHHHLTQHYYDLTPSMRAEGSFAKWDMEVQCRDLDAINAWSKAHAMEDAKYVATLGIP